METKRAFKPVRAVIGVAMILAGLGVTYWELFVHLGRIRIFGLVAALLVGVLGGILVLVRSLAKVCARCGTEVDETQLAFPPELIPAVQAYATQGGPTAELAASRTLQAEDRQRAILALDGCATCKTFTRVASHLAVWNDGGYFEAKQRSAFRPVGPDEHEALGELLQSRMR